MPDDHPPLIDRFPVRIAEIRQETPSVRSFLLDYGDAPFRFRPGQWIELNAEVAGEHRNGGYSIVSTPRLHGRIQLAVKDTPYPSVSRMLHADLRVGDELSISAAQGGFVLEDQARPVVLLGGGIGVTPLVSMLRHIREEVLPIDATLVYSAPGPDDVLFRDELEQMARAPNIRSLFTYTRTPGRPQDYFGRIDRRLLERIGMPEDALYYFCGSRDFIEDMSALLLGMGVAESQLRCEKWW